jgi:hypothetical protein
VIGADLESRVENWAASAISQYTGNAAVITAPQQMPEQQEGAAPASSESAARIRARSESAGGRRVRRGSGCADVYVPVQGPCR